MMTADTSVLAWGFLEAISLVCMHSSSLVFLGGHFITSMGIFKCLGFPNEFVHLKYPNMHKNMPKHVFYFVYSQWWMPDTGGANIPALNELLSPWNMAFG